MGVDITVLAVDWDHLMGIAPEDRAHALQDAAHPDDDDRVVHAGWVWFEPGHFAGLLSGWGEVVGEAERRGWGIVGLPI